MNSPIYKELCSIVSKTVGIEENLRAALEPLTARLSLALIYGSVAKQTDTASSDIDLLVVAHDLTLEDLFARLSGVEQRLGRQINPTLYTVEEFRKRRSDNYSGRPVRCRMTNCITSLRLVNSKLSQHQIRKSLV